MVINRPGIVHDGLAYFSESTPDGQNPLQQTAATAAVRSTYSVIIIIIAYNQSNSYIWAQLHKHAMMIAGSRSIAGLCFP